MNEITNIKPISQGGSVKKTLFVVAIAAMIVMACAGSAFAVDHSGNQREGVAASATAVVGGVSVAGAGTYTYLDWNPALGTNSLSVSPHGAFTTTTVKCAVCHAAHYAAPSGAPVGSGTSAADTLLRMPAGQACGYCHVAAGNTVNGTPVYNGVWPIPSSGGSTPYGHLTGTNCSECHSSVHGSGADLTVPAMAGFLLKSFSGGSYTGNLESTIATIEAKAQSQGIVDGVTTFVTGYSNDSNGWLMPIASDATASVSAKREEAVGVFCAECHNGSYGSTVAGAAGSARGGVGTFAGHRVMASIETTWTGKSTGSFNGKGQIAWAPATNCKSCHDSVDQFGNAAFPHAWGGFSAGDAAAGNTTKMWLTTADFQGGTYSDTTSQTTSYSTVKNQLQDGVCLKCHRGNAGASGVGTTF